MKFWLYLVVYEYPYKYKKPFGKSSTVSNEFVTDPDVLVNNLSFSHIREIMVLNDAFERFFLRNRAYEMQLECKRTNQI